MSLADIQGSIHLVFEICVAPLFVALFLLYNSVKRIEIMLFQNFVTKDEMIREIENVKYFKTVHEAVETSKAYNPH